MSEFSVSHLFKLYTFRRWIFHISFNLKFTSYHLKIKIHVKNNILYTLPEASSVGNKAIFHFSWTTSPFLSLIKLQYFKKKFLLLKKVLTKPRGLIWYVATNHFIEFNFFCNWAGGGNLKFRSFSKLIIIVFSNTGCARIWCRTV